MCVWCVPIDIASDISIYWAFWYLGFLVNSMTWRMHTTLDYFAQHIEFGKFGNFTFEICACVCVCCVPIDIAFDISIYWAFWYLEIFVNLVTWRMHTTLDYFARHIELVKFGNFIYEMCACICVWCVPVDIAFDISIFWAFQISVSFTLNLSAFKVDKERNSGPLRCCSEFPIFVIFNLYYQKNIKVVNLKFQFCLHYICWPSR